MATMDSIKNGLMKSNTGAAPSNYAANTIKSIMANPKVKDKFNEVLGTKAPGFIASVLSLATVNLKDVEPNSIATAALISATLDLPINPNLGFSYLVPFREKQQNGSYIKKAQFQLGYKGFIQLALRSGQYKKINVIEIYEGQIKTWNPLTEEMEFDFTNPSTGEIVGYAAFFRLVNGFEKTIYWTKQQVQDHANEYSKTINSYSSIWKKNFNAMAKKTVLKSLLSKWGILSVEMQTAIRTDQAVIKDSILNKNSVNEIEDTEINYVDNQDFIEVEPVAEETEQPETKDPEVIDGQMNITEVME